MPGKVIGIQMGLGFPGTYSRGGDCYIAARLVSGADSAGPSFGDPCVLNDDNTFSSVAEFISGGGTFAATDFAGVAVREIKQMNTYPPNDAIAAYAINTPADVLERGSVSVVCNVGTPKAGGAVYVRKTANVAIPAGVVGGFEAEADGGNTVLLTNAEWTTGAIDANKVAELTIKTRNRA